MKKTMMKWLMLVAVFGLMGTNVAEAAFRVKSPSTAVRQQALMSLQSMGAGDEEAVATTTKENPFTVDFAALGVENPTNAYLLIMNEQTGNAIALSVTDEESTKVEVSPLVLAELEMQHLGASQSYRCMAMCVAPNGKDDLLSSCRLSTSLGAVKMPNFYYRTDDGRVKLTTVQERKLVSVIKNGISLTMRDPDDEAQKAFCERKSKELAYDVLAYELPDGTAVTHNDLATLAGRDGFGCMGDVNVESYVCNGVPEANGMQMAATANGLTFNLDLSVPDNSVSISTAKSATLLGLQKWADALAGTVPVKISIQMYSFSSVHGPDYRTVIGYSSSPAMVFDTGNHLSFVEALGQQLSGKNFSEDYDINISMNTDMPFYYGTDGNCPSSKIDYTTLVLHEVAHGLGFMSTFQSSGYLTYHDDNYWYPMIFDHYLTSGGKQLVSMTQANCYNAMRSNALYFAGPNAVEANGGYAIKMYAPSSWQSGSSVSHWDESVTFRTFMQYSYKYPQHTISPQKLGLMKDIGWSLATSAPAVPDAPAGVSVTKGTIVGEVAVTWNASSGATSYNVYRSTSASGTYSAVKTGLTSCKYQDKNVSGTTTYYYKVAAVNSSGTSAQSSYDYGYAKAETVLTSIAVTGAASLYGGDYADYTCTAYYSDGSTSSSRDVSADSGCAWSLSYGASYATLSGRRLTAGYLTSQKTVTIRATYGGKTAEYTVTVIPRTVDVTFTTVIKGFFPDPDGNAASVTTKTLTFTVGSPYGDLPVPTTRSGYKFLGWFTASSGGTQITASSTVSGSVTKLYAQYGTVEPTVASVRTDAPSTVECGSTQVVKAYAGYTDGTERQITTGMQWSISNSGIPYMISGGVLTLTPPATATGTIRIAVTVGGVSSPTYTVTSVTQPKEVTLDANGGTVSPTSISQKAGTAFSSLPTPTRSGYSFLGWYTEAVGGTRMQNGTVYDGTYTVLYAHWKQDVVLLNRVVIDGATRVTSGGTATYACTAYFSDGTSQSNVPATWSVDRGAVTSVGAFMAPMVTAETTATVSASYTYGGTIKSATKTVTVVSKAVTVAFDANGGTVSPSTIEYTVGMAYGELPVPTWAEHVFDGWFTALDETGIPVSAETPVIEEATTLYAKWHDEVLIRGLTIIGPNSLESGATATYSCRANYSDGSTADVTPAWSFVSGGSYLESITAGGVLTAKQTSTSRTVVLKAMYGGLSTTITIVIRPKTVTVAFNPHGGTVAEASRSYVIGAKYASFPSVDYAGQRFLGWFTTAAGGTRILETTVVSASVTTLHAQWQENPPALKELFVSCEQETPVAISGATLQLICSAVYTNGAVTTTNVLNGSDVAWATDDSSVGTVGSGGVFMAGRVTSPSIAIVTARYQGMTSPEFAVWVEPEKVTVTFNANGGTISEASREYVVGAAYGAFPTATPRSEDYRFDGWFTAVNGGTRVTETMICDKTVTTLYAQWSEIVRLTGLRIEGENVVTSSVPVAFTCYGIYSDGSEVLAMPEWSVADAAHGVFDGDGVFTAAYVTEETISTIRAAIDSVTGMVDVVIQPLEVSVRFDPCNGAVTPQRMTFIVGSAYGELPTPVRSRYDFDGWFTHEGKSGDLITSASTVAEDVETLYAGWSPTPHSLTGIRIEGVEAVTSGGSAVFSCKAVYSDGTEGSVVPVWSLVKGLNYASLTVSGFFMAEEVTSSQKVTVQAVYTDKGIRYEAQHEVTIMPSTLVVDPGTLSLEAQAQNASVLVDSYGSWRVSVDVDWITLGKTSGSGIDTVGFSVTANEGNDERIGTITVTSDGLTETCVVKQYSPIPDEYVMVTLDTKIPGQTASQRQYIKGRKFGYLPTPVRAGYAFGGWWTRPNGMGARVHAMTVVSDDTLTLYGYWTDVNVAYALNNALDWVEDAAHPWLFDYTDAMDRKVSMTTPILGNRQSSSLSALVEGPGSISFYWKTSSEEYFDTLALYVDGKFVASISGETGWQSFSKSITGYGQHVITWTYAKDGQGAVGMDCAWLDMVTWTPDYTGSGAASIQSADGRAVPETWLNSYGLDTRSASLDDDADGDGMTNYEEYIAGTDPLDAESKFMIYIEMNADGTPQVEAIPDLGNSATRTYILEGKENMSDEEWSPADDTIHHFFRVRIEVK